MTSKLFLLLSLLFVSLTAQVHVTTIDPSQWGLTRLDAIRLGQLSLVNAPQGSRLNVQALYPKGYFSNGMISDVNEGCLEAADFSLAFINNLGGSYAVFESPPSAATFSHHVNGRDPLGRLEYTKQSSGYCGLWMHLFNSLSPKEERVYFDATRFASLQIRVRSYTKNERLLLKIADAAWNEEQDAVLVGELASFLPAGRIDTTWQTAVIPLTALPPNLDQSRLATVALEAAREGKGIVEFSSLSFCTSTDARQLRIEELELTRAESLEKAIWVWNTRDLIENHHTVDEMTSFLGTEHVNHVFLALPYDPDHPQASQGVPIDAATLGPIVRALNAAGHRVHALVGDKDFIRPDKRPFVHATMENIIRYQQSVPPAEQFYGIHLDIEPYLLPGFGSIRQSQFLENLLRVFEMCSTLARSARLLIGADIPPWLDAPNELTNMAMEVLWNGQTKPMYQHIIDIMDVVVLMNYRTKAEGEDGVVFQAQNELRYAEAAGKKVFLGLETIPLFDELLFVFRGKPRTGMPIEENAIVIAPGPETLAILVPNKARTELKTLLKEKRISEQHLLWWPVERTTPVSASRISFANGGGLPALRKTIEKAEQILRGFSSFAGFSFHDYESYRALMAK
ncbi:MAG: hypothetical protein HY563_04490 [Ignavibacteriales bacterium]|nr:hypothetical protein [Ignavibacteriales bacterium]